MKRRLKKVYKRLPPHTYEAHPFTNSGEASKPLIIGIIAIVAIIALSLLLLFSDQLVGKAFFADAGNTAGIADPGTVYANQAFWLTIKANIGAAQSDTVSFTLQLPEGVDCGDLYCAYDSTSNCGNHAVQSSLGTGWVDLDNKCENGKITFTSVNLGTGTSKTSSFEIAKINSALSGLPAKEASYEFTFDSFDVLDSGSGDNLVTPAPIQLEIKEAPVIDE